MLMAWDNWKATRAYLQGDINRAVSHLKQSKNSRTRHQPTGQNLARRLTQTLIDRAKRNVRRNDLPAAWRDLTAATEIASPGDQDRLSRRKSTLVELTIESADSLLTAGKITQALALVFELESRHILDWRSDRIARTARLIQRADDAAARGHVKDSNENLKLAINLRPDLSLLEARQKANDHRKLQIDTLSRKLEKALLDNQWDHVSQLCGEILTIAPNYQVALDAQRKLIDRKSSACEADSLLPCDSIREWKAVENSTAIPARHQQFLIWVDAVGGFLVCPNSMNIIGCAIPQANIEIPIMADLSRRHVKIQSTTDGHLIHPLANTATVILDGQTIASSTPWTSGQIMELDGGVKIEYVKPHPLSSSARLNLISRHRTQPWSDAVLLVNDTILLGPDSRNHVHCPHWSQNIVLFYHRGAWYCRCNQRYQVDSKSVQGIAILSDHSKIAGSDFSIGLEPVP